MGQKNNIICSYLSDPAVFADFVNGSLHHGEKVLLPHQLSERNAVSYSREEPRPASKQLPMYIERQRDTLKAACNNNHYLIIGIEAQETVNYVMPLRCMEYDVIEYKRQLKELKKKRNQPLTDAELLSGMAKEEKLNPVIIIVFYHGKSPYDGCINLQDMLELDRENKTYKRFISDYHINLIRPEDLDESMFETGLHELVGFLKRQNDKQELIDFMKQDRKRIERMDEETFDVVNTIVNLPKRIKKQIKNTEGDEHNMCKAMEDWIADERNAGFREGKIEGEKRGEQRGERRGERRGEQHGIKKGIIKGEDRFASLTSILLRSQRLDDLSKAVSDRDYRNSLYQEFTI